MVSDGPSTSLSGPHHSIGVSVARPHQRGKSHRQSRQKPKKKAATASPEDDGSAATATVPLRARCPCCKQEVVLASQRNLRAPPGTPWHGRVPPADAQAAAHGEYFSYHCKQNRLALYWACNDCIASGLALPADPARQKWCDCLPYYAYFDEERLCGDCQQPFVFTKEEQKHWYETLQFWVWSRPIYCKACKARRGGQRED